MQSLWSRAGQSRICGCKGCIGAASGMIRQSTTRVARRKVTFGEVFTAFYTSIMGTAAMMDANVKDKRRKDLDRQLEEVRADLDRLAESAVETTPEAGYGSTGAVYRAHYKKSWAKSRLQRDVADFLDSLGELAPREEQHEEASTDWWKSSGRSSWQKTSPHSAELAEMWRSFSLPHIEEGIAQGKQTDYDDLMNKLQAEEANPRIEHRAPRTFKQVIRSQGSTHSLISQLLRAVDLSYLAEDKHYRRLKRARYRTWEEDKAMEAARLMDSIDEQEPDEIRRLIRHMHADFSYPRYSSDGRPTGPSLDSTKEFNQVLRKIAWESFAASTGTSKAQVQDMVAKICYNLLVSPCPPNIHTLSMLLLSFDRIGHHQAANAVAVEILYYTKLKITPQTVVCLLNHYKEVGNVDRFHGLIDRCTGKDARGINVRRKFPEDVYGHRYLTNWARMRKVVYRGGVYNEQVKFDGNVVNAIVHGMLSLDCLRQAVPMTAFCWQQGIRICSRTILQLLDQVMYDLNHDLAFQVLRAIFRCPTEFWDMISPEHRDASLEKLGLLFDMCGLEASPSEALGFAGDSVDHATGQDERWKIQQSLGVLITQRQVDESQKEVTDLVLACQEHMALLKCDPIVSSDETRQSPTERPIPTMVGGKTAREVLPAALPSVPMPYKALHVPYQDSRLGHSFSAYG